MEIKCKRCGKRPEDILEYIEYADIEGMTPTEFVLQEEGTYNPATGMFYCTNCYIEIGMPLGKA